MARIRTIKPEFFTSLTIADLTPEQRLTFIGLWTQVDDEGRCVDDARLIKAALWPLDDRTASDIEIDVKALDAVDLITRYVCRGKRYIAVTNWHEHQKINRPSESKFPAPEDGEPLPPDPSDSRRAHGGLTEDSNGAVREACEGSQAGSAGARNADSPNSATDNAFGADEWQHSGGLTSAGVHFSEPSVSTHAQLTEGSPQERKGKEGNREGKGTPPTPRQSSDSPTVVQTGERAIEDRMTDAFLERYRAGNAYSQRQVRKVIADALANGTDSGELWKALERLGSLSKPVSAGTLQFAFSEIRQAQSASNVIALPNGQQLTGTDAKVAGWMAIAEQLRQEGDSA